MITDFFTRLEKSKWLGRAALSIIPALSFMVMLNGHFWNGIQLFATYTSIFLGSIAGNMLGKWIMIFLRKENSDLETRLCSGLSCFGFLFLPFVTFAWINIYVGPAVGEDFLRTAFWAACVGFIVFFALGSRRKTE